MRLPRLLDSILHHLTLRCRFYVAVQGGNKGNQEITTLIVQRPTWRGMFAPYHFAHVSKMVSGPILAPSGYAPR